MKRRPPSPAAFAFVLPGPAASRAAAALIVLAAAAVLPAACGRANRGDTALVAAVSVPPQAWLVERIGGQKWQTLVLISPGDSPATYQPSDIQISRVMQARVYFRTGVPFEAAPWFAAVTSRGGPEVVDLREGIPLRRMQGLHDHAEAPSDSSATERKQAPETGLDPHIWLDPALLSVQADTVASVLERLDPEGAAGYRANLAAVQAELWDTDAYIRQKLAGVAGRGFFIFHPSWGYFADAYGLRQIAVEIEGKEPADADITALKELARREGARVIFVQPQIGGPTARILAQAMGVRIETLDPLAGDPVKNLRHAADLFAEVLR